MEQTIENTNNFKINKLFEQIKQIENSNNEINEIPDKIIINIKDHWTKKNVTRIIEYFKNKIRISNNINKIIYIIHTETKLFKIERYLLSLIRFFEKNNIKYYTINIPLCYVQDHINNSLDLELYLNLGFEKNNYLKELKYFEDCKFCKFRNICPGALKKYEDQIFAVFKNSYNEIKRQIKTDIFVANEYQKIIEKLLKKLKDENLDQRFIFIKSDEYNEILKEQLPFNENIERITIASKNLEILSNTIKNNSQKIAPFNSKILSYKTIYVNKNKIIGVPLQMDTSDFVIIDFENSVLKTFKELLNEKELKRIENNDELLKLFLATAHTITHFIYRKENKYYLTNSVFALSILDNELNEFMIKNNIINDIYPNYIQL